MNIIQMTGGLGNQMFGYALLLQFKNMGIEAKIDDFSEYDNHNNARPLLLNTAFGIEYPRVSIEEYYDFTDSHPGLASMLKRKLRGRRVREYVESLACFDSRVLKQENRYLRGYFQSEKYFKDIKKEVINAFTFTPEVKLRAERILNQNNAPTPESIQSVSVHIRRGDYLDVAPKYGGICVEEYYDECLRRCCRELDRPVFYIFSNDIEWSLGWKSKHPELRDSMHVITGTDEDTGYIDMYLMSRCGHNILANSSFSWWASYLNQNKDKLVLAPDRWVNDYEWEDIYCSYMSRIAIS